MGRVRNRHQLEPHQHQRGVTVRLGVAVEVIEQLLAALPGVDPSAVERERAIQTVTSPEHGATGGQRRAERVVVVGCILLRLVSLLGSVCRVCRLARRQVVQARGRELDAAAHRLLDRRADREQLPEKPTLDVGVVGDPGREREHLPVETESDRRLVVRRRHQDASGRVHPQPEDRRRIQIREEDQRVIRPMVLLEIREQARAPRPLPLQPFLLVRRRMVVVEYPVGVFIERLQVPRAVVRETSYGHSADPVFALPVLVFPGDVVARAGGQHIHLMPAGEPLGDQPAVILGAAEYLRAVALDDERDLQGSSPTGDRRQEKPEGFAVVRFIFGSPMCLL